MNIKPLDTLSLDEVRMFARYQADAGEPMEHGFEYGSCKAIAFERAYVERMRELEEVEA